MRQCFILRTPDTNNKKPETVLLNAFVDPYDCLLNKKNFTKKIIMTDFFCLNQVSTCNYSGFFFGRYGFFVCVASGDSVANT